jgi:glycosyltransferase involved in cell wall biosynthesis
VPHPPRLLVLGSFVPSERGSRTVGEELAQRLAQSGWDVRLSSRRHTGAVRLADMLISVIRWRDSYDVALIGTFSGRAFLWAEACARVLGALGKPYILTLHGGALPEFAESNPARVRKLLAGAALVTAPSAYLQRRMEPYCDRILCIPNAVDHPAYRGQPRVRAGARVLWLRAFHDIYDPLGAVRVLALLAETVPDVRLVMAGPTKQLEIRSALSQLADELGVADRLEIVEAIPKGEVPDWLATGDIFLNTSLIDNAPVTVVEAMAAGLCVVTTDVGGIPDLVRDGEDALTVPPGRPDLMANAVLRILREPELARRLSANGLERSFAADWSSVLPTWQACFEAVRSSPGTRVCID